MKKLIIISFLLIISGCSTMTGLTVHKNELNSLKEYENGKCEVSTKNEKTIKTNFSCNTIKYFDGK